MVRVPAHVARESNLVGKSNWPGDAPFVGQIRDLRVFDRALTMDELTSLTTVSSGEASLCRSIPPPPPPPPPAPPMAASFALDVKNTTATIGRELYGNDLEFTRHDIFEGISAEMIANRKFAITDSATKSANSGQASPTNVRTVPLGFVAQRWIAVGEPSLDAPMWEEHSTLVTGDRGHSVKCSTGPALCGVTQTQVGDGFNSGRSSGSAITVQVRTRWC